MTIIAIINVYQPIVAQPYTSIKSIAFRRIKTLTLEVTIFSPWTSDSLIQESKKFAQVELVNVQHSWDSSLNVSSVILVNRKA